MRTEEEDGGGRAWLQRQAERTKEKDRKTERKRESKSRRTRAAGWRAMVPVGGKRVAKGGGVGTPRVRPDFNDSSATES